MDNISAVISRTSEHAVFPLVCADHCTWLLKKNFSDVAHDPEQLAGVFEYGLNLYGYDAVMVFVDAYVEAQALGCPLRFDPYPRLEGPRTATCVDRTDIVIDAAVILRQHVSVPVFVSIKGPFSLASFLAGVEEFLKMVLTDKKKAFSLVKLALDHQIAYARRLIDSGVHIFIGDPVASSSVISPAVFSDYALGSLQTLCKEITRGGMLAGIHICGDTQSIIPMLDEIDADILSVEDITPRTKTLKMGGVTTQSLLSTDHERVRKEVAAALVQFPLILSTSCDVPVQTDPNTLQTMISAYREYDTQKK
jgi:uroporphyrinogen decarboxylase